jgi:chromosome segregation ATPase
MNYLSSAPETIPRPDEFPNSLGARAQNRLSSFLTSRKSSPNLSKDATTPTSEQQLSTQELQRKLSQERELREKAEGQLTQASGELEELSASLFQQANEMVATERRERAKLEERVAILEKRDGEKRLRLERLEKAVQRIERVRGMLAQQA